MPTKRPIAVTNSLGELDSHKFLRLFSVGDHIAYILDNCRVAINGNLVAY